MMRAEEISNDRARLQLDDCERRAARWSRCAAALAALAASGKRRSGESMRLLTGRCEVARRRSRLVQLPAGEGDAEWQPERAIRAAAAA